MTFPNAAKGVKKLYTAEILGLIGMIITIVGLIAVVIGTAVTVAGAAAEQGSVAVGGLIGTGVGTIFSGAAAILTLIGFILQLVERHDVVFLPLSADVFDPSADGVRTLVFHDDIAGLFQVVRALL